MASRAQVSEMKLRQTRLRVFAACFITAYLMIGTAFVLVMIFTDNVWEKIGTGLGCLVLMYLLLAFWADAMKKKWL